MKKGIDMYFIYYLLSCAVFFFIMTYMSFWLETSAFYKRLIISLVWPITLLTIIVYIIKNKNKKGEETAKDNSLGS